MEEIVKLVQERTGLSEEQARSVVETVAGFIKDKLPEPIAGQIDSVLSGNMGDIADQAQSMLGGLGGMFGGEKKD